MDRPQGGPFWVVLGAVFALLLNGAAILLPIGLIGSPFHALGTAFALGWMLSGMVTSQASRSWVILGGALLLGVQLAGFALAWPHAIAIGSLLGMPLWALAAAHPVIRLPGLTMALPLGSALAVALAVLLAMTDLIASDDPLVHWGWVYAWGVTVLCVGLWHWWGTELPSERMHQAEAVLLGWLGAVILIPIRITLLPMMPQAHFGALAGLVDVTAIAFLFASAWGARQVVASVRLYERNPQ